MEFHLECEMVNHREDAVRHRLAGAMLAKQAVIPRVLAVRRREQADEIRDGYRVYKNCGETEMLKKINADLHQLHYERHLLREKKKRIDEVLSGAAKSIKEAEEMKELAVAEARKEREKEVPTETAEERAKKAAEKAERIEKVIEALNCGVLVPADINDFI